MFKVIDKLFGGLILKEVIFALCRHLQVASVKPKGTRDQSVGLFVVFELEFESDVADERVIRDEYRFDGLIVFVVPLGLGYLLFEVDLLGLGCECKPFVVLDLFTHGIVAVYDVLPFLVE